jgi:hypothetical protein
LYISLGAALDHLLFALPAAGHRPAVTVRPRPHADPDLAAEVTLSGRHQVTDADSALFAAIGRRHTDRQPFDKRPLPTPVASALSSAVDAADAELIVVGDEQRAAVADLIRRGGLTQFSDDASEQSSPPGSAGTTPAPTTGCRRGFTAWAT